ncbi:MAG: hypothetical protein J6D02_10800 [Lachnospira sp.]|nr:hypothetical protein [Lachnospira sp.]
MEKLVVGMDIQTEYVEACYFDADMEDVVEVAEVSSGEMKRVSNDLFFSVEENCWYCGVKAQELYMIKPGQMYSDIYDNLDSNSIIIAGGREYIYMDLFCILIRLQLEQLFGEEIGKLSKLVISSPMADIVLNKAVGRLARFLKLDKEQVELISPMLGRLFYIFSQDSSVWSYGAAVFHYDESLILERIQVLRYQNPMKITISTETFDSMPPVDASNSEKDNAFHEVVREAFFGRSKAVSGVYLVGRGFLNNWLDNSLDNLCRGRRVFMGQNMCAKGACYAAASGSAAISPKGDVYVNATGMIQYDIGIKVIYQGREQIAPIALGGREWFATTGSVTIFLDDTNRIEIDMYHRGTNELVKEVIEIKGLPNRPPKTTKLTITVRYLDERRGEICIRDKGFGTMYPTTGKMYIKEFLLPEER